MQTKLNPKLCDVVLTSADGEGMISLNAQARDTNEWYHVPPVVEEGLYCPPYFDERAHLVSTPGGPV